MWTLVTARLAAVLLSLRQKITRHSGHGSLDAYGK